MNVVLVTFSIPIVYFQGVNYLESGSSIGCQSGVLTPECVASPPQAGISRCGDFMMGQGKEICAETGEFAGRVLGTSGCAVSPLLASYVS